MPSGYACAQKNGYTLAKVHSALAKAGVPLDSAAVPSGLTEGDVALLGLASYADSYLHSSAQAKDSARWRTPC